MKARRSWVAWAALAALTAFAVFVLPFQFPLSLPVSSEAYAAGENNKVAAIAVVLLSVLATAVLWRWGRSHDADVSPHQSQLGWRWLAAMEAVALAFTAGLGSLMVRAGDDYGEAAYFLAQLETGLRLHRTIYRGFEFAYGPLLYAWPAFWVKALTPLHVSSAAAYVVALTLMQLAGFGLLFYTVNALPIARSLKMVANIAFLLGSLSPSLGLNYSIFRFLCPLAIVVSMSRRKTVAAAALVAAAGVAVNFAVSPEMGIGFAAACAAYGLYRGTISGWSWLTVAGAGLAGGTAFAWLGGPAYFLTMRNLAHGGFNLIVAPEPRTIALLVAVVALAPVAVARWLRAGQTLPAETAMLLGIYCIALSLVPVALGRCDAVHEYFDGLAAFLLSLVAVNAAAQTQGSRVRARVWVGCVVFAAVLNQKAAQHLYWESELMLIVPDRQEDASQGVDVQALERVLGGEPVILVNDVPPAVHRKLLADGLLAPSYFRAMTAVWDQSAEQKKIEDMRLARFALLSMGGVANPPQDWNSDGTVRRWAALGLHYRQKRSPYVPGFLLQDELRANWVVAGAFGEYVLYRRLR